MGSLIEGLLDGGVDLGASRASQPTRGRVLIAESDDARRSGLTDRLTAEGYAVTCTATGADALSRFVGASYDLVLVDDRLDDIEAGRLTAALRALHKNSELPVLAMPQTVGIESVMAHINAAARPRAAGAAFDPFNLPGEVDVAGKIARTFDNAMYAFEPAAPEARREPTSFLESADIPLVVIDETVSAERCETLLESGQAHLALTIDLTGRESFRTRLAFAGADAMDAAKVALERSQLARRRAMLAPHFLTTEDISERLLAHVFLREADLTPRLAPERRGLTEYNVLLDPRLVVCAAEDLVRQGLFRRMFFDVVHACDGCGSSRLHVREVCGACKSADVGEMPYLHHFACGHQAIENDFRIGDDLVCPKCRQKLRHFGLDYDKPGTFVHCRSCGTNAAEPAAGARCLDCGTEALGDEIRTRTIHAYCLTDTARRFLETGALPRLILGDESERAVPKELTPALTGAMRAHERDGTPFVLAVLAFAQAHPRGARTRPSFAEQARRIFEDNLRAELEANERLARSRSALCLLLFGTSEAAGRARVEKLVAAAQADLGEPLAIDLSVYGPDTIERLTAA